jgi:small subunit ribosomal protein S6
MNIECDQKIVDELTGAFRFSDAVLRHLVTSVDSAIIEPSHMAKAEEEEAGGRRERPRDDAPGSDDDDGGRRRDRVRDEPLLAEADEGIAADEPVSAGRLS